MHMTLTDSFYLQHPLANLKLQVMRLFDRSPSANRHVQLAAHHAVPVALCPHIVSIKHTFHFSGHACDLCQHFGTR